MFDFTDVIDRLVTSERLVGMIQRALFVYFLLCAGQRSAGNKLLVH